MSAPYAADTAQLLPYTLGQSAVLTAWHASWGTMTLELQGGTVSFDEQRAPRCQATFTLHVPEDQVTLDRLDPRTGVRLRLSAGYVRPDAIDVQPVADLLLTRREVTRPSNLLTLTAQGEEVVALASRPPAPYTTGTDLAPAVIDTLTRALGSAPNVVENTVPQQNLVATSVLDTQDYWTQLDDWCDRANADLYDDGLRRWHLSPRPVLGAPRASLTVGAQGVLTGASTALDRQGWYNATQLTYRWTTITAQTITHEKDGGLLNEANAASRAEQAAFEQKTATQAAYDAMPTGDILKIVTGQRLENEKAAYAAAVTASDVADASYANSGTSVIYVTEEHVIIGTAVAGGAYAPAVAGGRSTYSETRDVATTQAAADNAAAVVLGRMLTQGRTLDLEAVAHWWLRPSHTVAAQLPTGGVELCLASAVSFDLTTGRMRVRTRRPDTDTTVLRGG